MKNFKLNINYILLTTFIFLGFGRISAQETTVPVDLQVELLAKILSLNKSFDLDDSSKSINVGILYSSSLRQSVRTKDEIIDQTKGNIIQLKKTKAFIKPIEITNINSLKNDLLDQKIDVLYITPIRGYNITEITHMCRESQILTFTGVSNFISDNDISVGFDLQNNKLQITINLESAKAEGANFSSRLLNVSQIK